MIVFFDPTSHRIYRDSEEHPSWTLRLDIPMIPKWANFVRGDLTYDLTPMGMNVVTWQTAFRSNVLTSGPQKTIESAYENILIALSEMPLRGLTSHSDKNVRLLGFSHSQASKIADDGMPYDIYRPVFDSTLGAMHVTWLRMPVEMPDLKGFVFLGRTVNGRISIRIQEGTISTVGVAWQGSDRQTWDYAVDVIRRPPLEYDRAVARTQRHGQTQPVQVYTLDQLLEAHEADKAVDAKVDAKAKETYVPSLSTDWLENPGSLRSKEFYPEIGEKVNLSTPLRVYGGKRVTVTRDSEDSSKYHFEVDTVVPTPAPISIEFVLTPEKPKGPFTPAEFRTTQHLGGMGLASIQHPAFATPVRPLRAPQPLAKVTVEIANTPGARDRANRLLTAMERAITPGCTLQAFQTALGPMAQEIGLDLHLSWSRSEHDDGTLRSQDTTWSLGDRLTREDLTLRVMIETDTWESVMEEIQRMVRTRRLA